MILKIDPYNYNLDMPSPAHQHTTNNLEDTEDIPYLSLGELLENCSRLGELPLFIIPEKQESLNTQTNNNSFISRQTSQSTNHWNSNQDIITHKIKRSYNELQNSGKKRVSISNRVSVLKCSPSSELEKQLSFKKGTSIQGNYLTVPDSKEPMINAFQGNQNLDGQSFTHVKSRKSHFSPENETGYQEKSLYKSVDQLGNQWPGNHNEYVPARPVAHSHSQSEAGYNGQSPFGGYQNSLMSPFPRSSNQSKYKF